MCCNLDVNCQPTSCSCIQRFSLASVYRMKQIKWPPRHNASPLCTQNSHRATTGDHVTIKNGHRATTPAHFTHKVRTAPQRETTLRFKIATAPQRQPTLFTKFAPHHNGRPRLGSKIVTAPHARTQSLTTSSSRKENNLFKLFQTREARYDCRFSYSRVPLFDHNVLQVLRLPREMILSC